MATIAFDRIYQLKITLMGSKPPIWRRILVPANISFHKLHSYIQFAMGWESYHLYGFKIPPTGTKVDESIFYGKIGTLIDDDSTRKPKTTKIAEYLFEPKQQIVYCYDFGDDWMHSIELEEIIEPVQGKKYPICTDGKRACPPEDCGGIMAYQEMLEALEDPDDPDYEVAMEWFE
ncbi:MAG: plasmid pRiA4b ORF-3 family protein, partial [Candidatus Cloacimonadaceae bacterium]|nr:plasmid pRiA4b ORF-3 family protein [Candidatus Cloacimonadaceae bacterium]